MKCSVCKELITFDMSECLSCGAALPAVNGKHSPPPCLDDAKPVSGVLTDTYEKWIHKRVRIKATNQTGKVFGVDACPMPHPGVPSHPKTIDSGYLHIWLDKPTPQSDRVFADPDGVELLG